MITNCSVSNIIRDNFHSLNSSICNVPVDIHSNEILDQILSKIVIISHGSINVKKERTIITTVSGKIYSIAYYKHSCTNGRGEIILIQHRLYIDSNGTIDEVNKRGVKINYKKS